MRGGSATHFKKSLCLIHHFIRKCALQGLCKLLCGAGVGGFFLSAKLGYFTEGHTAVP